MSKTTTEQELTAIRMNLEDISTTLKKRMVTSPLTSGQSPVETYRQIKEQLRIAQAALGDSRTSEETEGLGVFPTKFTWMEPNPQGLATAVRLRDGRVKITIVVEGEDADIVADLIETQPVEALSIDSVAP